jgi:hypothetical protein
LSARERAVELVLRYIAPTRTYPSVSLSLLPQARSVRARRADTAIAAIVGRKVLHVIKYLH